MSVASIAAAEALARLHAFDTIIDARSPGEFALDHLPGAVNWPSLDDEERARVGTEYKQVSPFLARKRGAALVARNIAGHIERELIDTPKHWQPLVYCWRGGQRSGSLAMVLGQIGFRVQVLEGGYREYRRAVMLALEALPARFAFRVLCGATGSGKSRLLHALAAQGEQVLDLEALANHRGSVLGLVPGSPQPTQKAFDSALWAALQRLDAARPVWIESESKKVGEVRVPEALVQRMRAAPCVRVDMPVEARVHLLMADYSFFVRDVAAFCTRLDALRPVRGNEVINQWQAAARSGGIEGVVRELLTVHYDPVYLSSTRRNFTGFDTAQVLALPNGETSALAEAASGLRESCLTPAGGPAGPLS